MSDGIGQMKTIFRKDYDGESVYEVGRDVSEALIEEYNDVWKTIPTDEHGFSLGTIRVTIEWYGDEDE